MGNNPSRQHSQLPFAFSQVESHNREKSISDASTLRASTLSRSSASSSSSFYEPPSTFDTLNSSSSSLTFNDDENNPLQVSVDDENENQFSSELETSRKMNNSVKPQQVKAITFGDLKNLTTLGLCSRSLVSVSSNIWLLTNTTTLQL